MASVDDRVHGGPQLASAVEGIAAASRQAQEGGHTLGGFVRRCNAVGYGFFARCRGCGVEVAVHRVGQMWTYPDSLPGCPARAAAAPSPAAGSNGAGPRPALRVLSGGGLDGVREPHGQGDAARRPGSAREAAPPRPAPGGGPAGTAGAPTAGPSGRPSGGPATTPITEVLAAARLAAHRSGHRLGVFRRSNGGRKFVAGCHRCGWELPVLHTDRGWCFPPPSRRCSGP